MRRDGVKWATDPNGGDLGASSSLGDVSAEGAACRGTSAYILLSSIHTAFADLRIPSLRSIRISCMIFCVTCHSDGTPALRSHVVAVQG